MLADFKKSTSSLASTALDENINSLKAKEKSLRKRLLAQQNIFLPEGEEPEKANDGKREGGDWTDAYRRYGRWEDADELKAELTATREKIAKLKKKKEKPNPVLSSCCSSQDRSAERKVALMSNGERLRSMKDFRAEGNGHFSAGEYRKSLSSYERALNYFEYCIFDSKREEADGAKQRLLCLLNCAACFLRLDEHGRCIDYCTQALEIDPDNSKARFRRARAHRFRGDFDEARNDLEAAKASCSERQGAELEEEEKQLDEAVSRYKEQRKVMAKQMMAGKPKQEGSQ